MAHGDVLTHPAASRTARLPAAIRERARRVRLLLLDADGVLTDGRLYLADDGREARAFDVRDGHGLYMAREAGLALGIVSGRESGALARRAAELGIRELHQGVRDKDAVVRDIQARLGIGPEETCFVGDDLIDVRAMRRAGLSAAPADAVDEARAAAHWVTDRPGGRGAVREVIEVLLRASGSWERVASRYLDEEG